VAAGRLAEKRGLTLLTEVLGLELYSSGLVVLAGS